MIKVVLLLVQAAIIVPLLNVEAHASSRREKGTPAPQIRTYVSGRGADINSCTVLAPCRTFQYALGVTLAGGEIFVLDSANYGPLLINKAITITSEGAVAGVLTASGTGITINAGANDVVSLRGLEIDGGNSGDYGVHFISGGALNFQKSTIRGFGTGINFSPAGKFSPAGASALLVSDTLLTLNRNNGALITSSGSNLVNGAFSRVTASWNGIGIFANGANVNVVLSEFDAGNNTYGVGANAATAMIRNSTLSNNSVGMAADQAAIIRVGQSAVTANLTGWQATNSGKIQSYGNNNVSGNTSDGSSSTTLALN